MNPSNFQGFQGVENVSGTEALRPSDPASMRNTQQQPPQLMHQHNQTQPSGQHAPHCLQSSIQQQSFMADPVQLQIRAQIAAQAQLQSENQPPPQSDLQLQIQHAQSRINLLQSHVDVLRSQANEQQLQMLSQQMGQNPSSQLHMEPQQGLPRQPEAGPSIQLDENPPLRSQYQLAEVPRPGTSTEFIPPLRRVCTASDPIPNLRSSEPTNAQTDDIEVDEIQPNPAPKKQINPKMPTGQRPRHSRKAHSSDKNLFKGQRVTKNTNKAKNRYAQHASNNTRAQPYQQVEQSTGNSFDSDIPLLMVQQNLRNSNASLTVGSASNVNNSKALKIVRSEARVRCLGCDRMFADPQAMRRHFLMTHSKTDKSMKKTCPECLLVCHGESRLKEHWSSSHIGQLDYACNECGARFSKNRNLSLHQTKFHRKKSTNANVHKCSICDFTSEQKLDVVIHFFGAHSDEEVVECPGGCGRKFNSMWHAKNHFFDCTHMAPGE